MASPIDNRNYDGLGLAALVADREVSATELVEDAIARIEALNPTLNAVIHRMDERARAAACRELPTGPFRGVPFLLKDLLAHHAGVPTSSGSRFHNGFVPDHDSELVRRFKATGLVIVGKTNTSEYGLLPVTEPELFGPTRNPWDPTRTAGGSSGGAAAAVAAGMVPLAHGNDGGGSIRVPASACGLFGLKPSRGRTPSGRDLGEAWNGAIAEHVLTRTVRDSAAMLDAISGEDVGSPYYAPPPTGRFLDQVVTSPGRLRIAVTATPLLPAALHPDCAEGLKMTVGLLEDLGHQVEDAAPPIDRDGAIRALLIGSWAMTRAEIEEAEVTFGRKATFTDFELETWVAGLLGQRITTSDLMRSIRLLQRTARQISGFFEDYDVLVTPTLAAPPPLIGELRPTGPEAATLRLLARLNAGRTLRRLGALEKAATDSKIFGFMPNTTLFNTTGQPAMSVPLHHNADGLPIGIQFVGRYGDEATLLRLAGQLETARPWFHRTPDLDSPPSTNLATDGRADTTSAFHDRPQLG